ncbi:MAG: hypothetical protein GY757_20880, partial [bacterium]|nr:hypothetical protein [bacterium]
MKIFQHLSIKNKLIVFVLMISLLSITLGMTFVIFNNIKTYKDDMVYNTTTIAQFLAEACGAPLSFEFDDELEKELKRLKGMEIVENGCVFDAEGQVYISYSRTVDNTFTPPPPRHE